LFKLENENARFPALPSRLSGLLRLERHQCNCQRNNIRDTDCSWGRTRPRCLAWRGTGHQSCWGTDDWANGL